MGTQRLIPAILLSTLPAIGLGLDPHFTFTEVKPGEFVMGSPVDEKDRYANEVPHQVRITRGYEIGTTEVTQGLWRKVMGSLPRRVLRKDDALPVTYVSWNDAQEFLKRLRVLRRGDGYVYRLPTEAEWEYAARGAHKAPPEQRDRPFPNGETAEGLDDYAWSWSNSKIGAMPVATRKPNPLGLYDMHGNVWEWTEDTYTPDASRIPVDPAFGHPVNTGPGPRRVLRSGCWTRNARILRSAFRGRLPPEADYGNLGVRLVRVPAGP